MTLRDALRRALWIGFALIAISAIAFWGLAKFAERAREQERLPLAKLPLFFNAKPRNARDLALTAMHQVARGESAANGAKKELVRLGGAALPHILPALDTLDPRGRGRVALALVPVAERMGLVTRDELKTPEAAVPFWTRFWQDRAIDFRPQVVRRLVRRLAERSFALRREDIQHLDTYAMGALIAELGTVQSTEDAARVRRITGILSHVTGIAWRPERDASADEARQVAERWYEFWAENGADFSTLDGLRRLTAVVTETRYAKWIDALQRGGLGRTRDGHTALEQLRVALLPTLTVLLIALAAGAMLGVFWASAEELPALHRPTRFALALFAIVFASFPLAVVSEVRAGQVFLTLSALLTTGALMSRYARSVACSPRANWSVWRRTKFLLSAVAPALGIHASLLLSGILAVEAACGLPGLGTTILKSLREYDVNAWMATSLTIALALLVIRHVCDVLFAQSAKTGRVFLEEESVSA